MFDIRVCKIESLRTSRAHFAGERFFLRIWKITNLNIWAGGFGGEPRPRHKPAKTTESIWLTYASTQSALSLSLASADASEAKRKFWSKANELLTATFFWYRPWLDLFTLLLDSYGAHNLCDFTKNTKVIFFSQLAKPLPSFGKHISENTVPPLLKR